VLYPVELLGGRTGRLMLLNPMTADHRRLPADDPLWTEPVHAPALRRSLHGRLVSPPRHRLLVFHSAEFDVRGEHLVAEAAVVFDGVWKKFPEG
jgi:hypothetical protein